MEEYLYSLPGVAVAAPQLGLARRIILINMRKIHTGTKALILINPLVKDLEGEVLGEEGCLSVPGIFEEIPRARRVRVEGMDPGGGEVSLEAEEILARVLQHEIDHLNGRLFWDHLPERKRNKLRGKYLQYWEANPPSPATPTHC